VTVDVVDPSRVWLRRTPLTDAWAVLRSAARAFAGHWPVLFALCFFGIGARALINAEAVHAAHVNAIFGMLVFLAGPVVLILALVLAMRSMRPSLPYLSRVGAGSDARWRTWRTTLAGIGSVAVPFVGVYYGSGFLAADTTNYYYDVFMYDPLHKPSLPEKLTVTAVVVVVVAFIVRTVLAHWPRARRQRWLGIPRAYLEIVWIMAGALLIHPLYQAGKAWVLSRRATGWLAAAQDQVYGLPHNPMDWFGAALGSIDVIIGLPIAWLVVGAVVFGREIETEREEKSGFARRTVLGITEESFGPLRSGVYLITRAGLASVLGFCVLFVLAKTVDVGLFEVERLLIGPRDFGFWVPASEITSTINTAAQLVALVCLVAGAADRTLWIESHRRIAGRPAIPAQRSNGAETAAGPVPTPTAAAEASGTVDTAATTAPIKPSPIDPAPIDSSPAQVPASINPATIDTATVEQAVITPG